jgi:hypothetical protein
VMHYILNLSSGYAESGSNSRVCVSLTSDSDSPRSVLLDFISNWQDFFIHLEPDIKDCCKTAKQKASNRFCSRCGSRLDSKENDEEKAKGRAADYFDHEYLRGSVDGFGLFDSDNLCEFMSERGWHLWGCLPPGQTEFTIITCCKLPELISGEYELQDWMWEYRKVRTE